MAEEKTIVVGYKVQITISKSGGFREGEIGNIRKIVEKRIANVEKETERYLKEYLVFLQSELSVTYKWTEEEMDKIRIRDVKVKQIPSEGKKEVIK